MNIICVSGGSYKSFYLNYFLKLKSCDLIIFNFGIIYDYDICDELMGNAVVTKELKMLSKILKAQIVAGVYINNYDKRYKGIIVCNNDKIQVIRASIGVKIFCKKYDFIVGDENVRADKINKIVLSNRRIYPNLKHCSNKKIMIFFDKYGVGIVQNQKLTRKFYKYSKIILK